MFHDLEDDRYEGDPRRCPSHPNVVTSSADGLHDGVCGRCEHDSYLRELEDELVWPHLGRGRIERQRPHAAPTHPR